MKFDGQVVVVTGGGGGIGATLTARFAAEGAVVVVADIDAAAAHSVADRITRARAIELDVANHDQVQAAFGQIHEELGAVNVLVNNAATCSDTPYLELREAEWVGDLDVSLKAAFLTTQAALPRMVERRSGTIINVASVNGLIYYGNEGYSAAKAGLLSLTRSLAVRFGRHGIRCNAVVPGTVATATWDHRVDADPGVLAKAAAWYPLGRVGTADDVASAVLFLASAEASWITGTALTVDGGLTAGNLQMTDEIVARRDA